MSQQNINDEIHKLFHDYLDLCESSKNMKPYEFGFQIIAFTTKLLLKTSPNEGSAYRVILAGMEQGFRQCREEKNELIKEE